MNREYLGPTIKKGSFLCRNFKVGGFEIGKETIEEVDSFLRDLTFATIPTRVYDPYNIVRSALKQMRGYNVIIGRKIWEEDVIRDQLDEDVCVDRMQKWRQILSVEEEMKKVDPNFQGFYSDLPYFQQIDKCIEEFDNIMAQVPQNARDRVNPSSPEADVVLEISDEEDQPGPSDWDKGGKKKQKLIEVPKKAREKALQVLPKGTEYFDDARQKFLIDQATQEERRPNRSAVHDAG